MNKVLITGGTGFLGSHLIPILHSKGLNISLLSRKLQSGSSFQWDVNKGTIDPDALNGTETIIHLAGSGIADKRWTKSYKKEILESRVKSAGLLFQTLKSQPHSVKTFISASAIGYYGDCSDVWVEEEFHAKEDFLGHVCTEWEKSARQFETLGIRVVIFRIGIVLAKDGGAFPQLARPVKLFAGSALGSGDQYMSWIHIEDLCRMFSLAVTDQKLHGVYNAVAPSPVTNAAFVKETASVLKRPFWPVNVPAFVLKLLLGEKAAIVLDGQRVASGKIRMAGFEYLHQDLNSSLKNLLNKQ